MSELAWLYAVIVGTLSGMLWGAIGYIKFGKPKGEKFSGPKFLRAVLIGGAVGFVANLRGVSFEEADLLLHLWLVPFGGSIIVDWIAAWLWKKIKPPKEPAPGGDGA